MGSRARAVAVALGVMTIGSTAALAPAAAAVEGGETPAPVAVGDEAPANFYFDISPRLLLATDPGATELKVWVEASPPIGAGEGLPPGIHEARIGLDRSIRLDPGNLPVCRRPGVNFPQVDASGAELCPRAAVVGRAEATIEVAFPEAKPIILATKGKVYIGGTRGGVPQLLVGMPVEGPIGGTIAFLLPVLPVRGGRIGNELAFTAPALAGGDGTFLSLQLDLRHGFIDRGERTGYVTAECHDRKLVATLAVTFIDGTQYSEDAVRACSA